MNFPINLIGELIAVTPERIQGPIRLPDWKRSLKGTVIARGPDARDVREGEIVSFGAAVGMDSVLAGQEIRILKERDLDFVYEPHEVDNFGHPFPRMAQQYTLNDDPLPCRCTVNQPCIMHMIQNEA
jgi:hypothetical protein